MKRTVPLIITFVTGFLLVVAEYVPPMKVWREDALVYFQIIAVFAFFLGGGSLLKINLQKIAHKRTDWQFSLITVIGFFIMLAFGLFKLGNPGGISGDLNVSGSWFQNIFDGVKAPLSASMYSLLAFFIASASYRAFRAKNSDAVMLLGSAFVILMGQTFVGVLATGWLPDAIDFFKVENLSLWLLAKANLAGQRAILIGIALGIISMSLRVILGIERTHLSGGED